MSWNPVTSGRSRGSTRSGRRVGWRSAAGLFACVALTYLVGAVLSWQSFGAGVGPAFFPPAGRDSGGDAADAAIAMGSRRPCDCRRGVGCRSPLRGRRRSGVGVRGGQLGGAPRRGIVGIGLVQRGARPSGARRSRQVRRRGVPGRPVGRRGDRQRGQRRVKRRLMASCCRALVGRRRDRRSGGGSTNPAVAHSISHPASPDSGD